MFSEFGPMVVEYQQQKRGTASGENGTFEDACDADGHLIEQTCVTMTTCFAPPGADCAPRPMRTGQVAPVIHDCLGLCKDGACNLPCPKVGDELDVSFDAAAQIYRLVPAEGEVSYLCTRAPTCAATVGDARLRVLNLPNGLDSIPDCSVLFSDGVSPLRLSDGCGYVGCTTMRRSKKL